MVTTYFIVHRSQRGSPGHAPNRAWYQRFRYATAMLRYHVAYYLPRGEDRMVVAEVLDFPGVFSQGFDLPDARSMVASALSDVAQVHLEQGLPFPIPNADASALEADLIELLPLTVEVGTAKS